MKSFSAIIAPAFLAMVFCSGCDTASDTDDKPAGPEGIDLVRSSQPYEAAPDVAQEDRAALRQSHREFAFTLYREVASRAAPDENLFLDTHGISTVLAMTYAGARGTTESEMATALGYALPQPLTQAAIHPTMNDLSVALRTSVAGTPVRYDSHNAIWLATDHTVQPSFLDVLSVHYDTGVYLADFASDPEGARTSINGWVSVETDGFIPELFGPGAIDSTTKLALTNAAFLAAPWKDRFDPNRTHEAEFALFGGDVVDTPMMSRQWEYPFAFDIDWRALALPFRDSSLSAVFLLPNAGEFAELEERLDAALVQRVMTVLEAWHDHPAIVQVMVPRFEFSSVVNLRPSLEGLGMVSAFDLASADFTGIEPEGGLFVDTLEHRTTVQVDEEGMTGAAATSEVLAYSPITPQLRFNRPFFFFVYDHATGTVLFVGRFVRPAGQARPPTDPPVAQSDAEVICSGLALRCPARTTTEADCLAALAGADPAVVERCADCLLMHFDSYAEGMCEPATCGEFCPTHPF